jgi:hypothetical protein
VDLPIGVAGARSVGFPAGVGRGSAFGVSVATTGASASGGSLGGNSPLRRIRVGGGVV